MTTRSLYRLSQTTISIAHDDDTGWGYIVHSNDPGIRDSIQDYHKSQEEALADAKKHIQECVTSAIKKREQELEVLRSLLSGDFMEVKP